MKGSEMAVGSSCFAKVGAMAGVPSMIRILTVDDHPLLRKGIAALVNAEPDLKLVAEASNGEEAIGAFRLHRPDVTLMDLQMPGVPKSRISASNVKGARVVSDCLTIRSNRRHFATTF